MIKILPVQHSRVGIKSDLARIAIKEKKGNIRLNKAAVALLDLKQGDKLNFAYDDDIRRFYLFKSDEGYHVNSKNNEANFSALLLVNKIVEAYQFDKLSDEPKMQSKVICAEPILFDGFKLFKIQLTEKE